MYGGLKIRAFIVGKRRPLVSESITMEHHVISHCRLIRWLRSRTWSNKINRWTSFPFVGGVLSRRRDVAVYSHRWVRTGRISARYKGSTCVITVLTAWNTSLLNSAQATALEFIHGMSAKKTMPDASTPVIRLKHLNACFHPHVTWRNVRNRNVPLNWSLRVESIRNVP